MDSNLSGSSFNSRLTHAQSTPAGVDGSGIFTLKTPPTTPKKNGKMLAVRVQMLDESITIFQVQAKAVGRLLFDQVCKQLNLLEADYFGLEYQDATTKYWLDFEKPMHRQIGLSLADPFLKFCVKFYTPDPAQLEEEYTRYLFCLQIKRDLMQGDLQCNDNTAALIISYIVQAECGDYSSEDYPDHTYLSSLKFVSYQDKELERKIMENHKRHAGQSPAEADLNLLETARRCELYGMKMHPAKDQEGVPLNLAVAHMGIVVFQNCTKINTFSWAKIRKISFKRKRFLIKLHPEGYGYYKDIVEFVFDNRNQCKSFWKKCVENHGFFRCSYVKCIPRQKARVLSRGSSFRYSGKTQKQMVEYVRENYVKRQNFQRSQSFRHQSSLHSSVVNVGASISAHPLLPLGENAVAGSGASLSCESMTLSGSLSPTTLQDGGPQTAPTVMNQSQQPQQQEHPQVQQQQIHQMQVDLHEPATTSSDITSIASQSPPFDTGLNRRYRSTSNPRIITNHPHSYSGVRCYLYNTNKTNKIDSQASVKGERDRAPRTLNYEHDNREQFSETKLQNFAQNSVNKSSCSRSNVNEPDILRDLGEPERGEEFSWQRSASCKELGAAQKQDQRSLLKCGVDREAEKSLRTAVNKFDSYRHCYSCYGQPPLFDNSSRSRQSADAKVYSSSYPGTIASTSVETKNKTVPVISAGTSPGVITVYADDAVNEFENDYEEIDRHDYQKLSADDLSHDSYEIIERESVFRSRSSSVNSDEMFVMENDYKSISKHILWREGSADVERRLGYVEPRYRNVNFNEFNEICKRGFALRNRDASQSHGNIKFSEFSVRREEEAPDYTLYAVVNKKRSSNVVVHESVSRTKSDPHMTSQHKLLNRQKLFGVHQKSFDMAVPTFGDTLCDTGHTLSKSSADIPYTLRIRNQMNGTARDSESHSGHNSACSPATCTLENGANVSRSDSRTHQNSDLLSSTYVDESVDGNGIDLKHVLLTKNSYEEVVTTKKSTKLMLSLSEENNESTSAAGKEPSATQQNIEEEKASRRGTKRSSIDDGGDREEHEQHKDKQHIVKVKSVETPKKSHSTRVRKSKSAETYDHKSSFLHADASGSRGKKEIIVIDSDDYHSFDDSRSDKRSDGSDSVLIVEYRGNKKKKLSKKASSDSRGSQAESEASSFDAPRIKKKDLKKRNAGQTYFYKDRIPTIEISEDETYKAENKDSVVGFRLLNDYEYSSDERPASGSDLSKTEVINELVADENSSLGDVLGHNESITDNDEMDKDMTLEDDAARKMKVDTVGTWKSAETMECDIRSDSNEANSSTNLSEENFVRISDAASAEKNIISAAMTEKCQIFSKLGLSEGSAVVSNDRSPQNTRRAKSLDTPIVSLHRLPPITSFSSKDDTLDSEGVILEEKSLMKQKRTKSGSSELPAEAEGMVTSSPISVGEVSVAKKTKSINLVGEKPEIKPKPNLTSVVNRLMSSSVAVSSLRKQSFDAAAIKTSEVSKTSFDSDSLNKERSKSEGYDRNLAKLSDSFLQTLERKHSTRQERLDSFRKLKNFSIELWDVDVAENSRKRVGESNNSEEYEDDNVFEDVDAKTDALVPEGLSKEVETSGTLEDIPAAQTDFKQNKPTAFSPPSSCSNDLTSNEKESEDTRDIHTRIASAPELKSNAPGKSSFDEEHSSLSSTRAEQMKYTLESSGSSSVDEAILPPDYIDDEDLPALPPTYMSLDMVKATNVFGVKPLATSLSTPFNPGFFSLSRTLSRISERSTEQERTDMDDDSTKPLSRSLSIDDSILSSDQHLSFSSDPPSGMNLENVFDDDDDLEPTIQSGEDIPDYTTPSLLTADDEDWPSPPHSPSSITTPTVDDECCSSVNTILTEESAKHTEQAIHPAEDEEESISEDNKILHEGNEDTSNDYDNGEKPRMERKRESVGDDTSLGLTTSDLSSSTGNTVKQAHAAGTSSCANKSEDSSLAGDFAMSLSTDILSESRKSSIDETLMSYEKKYLTLDRKQTSLDRRYIFFPSKFPSFDDEYDSPYTESDDSPSSPLPPVVLRKQLPSPPPLSPVQLQPSPQKLPLPPRHYQDAAQSTMQKIRNRVERNRAAKFTSSSMSTSLESPTNAERKFAKAVAKAKCHSYFSLARSPPSDCSSSSAEAPDTPLTPNTIPRVSKRRRNTHTHRRRQQRPVADLLHKSSSSASHTQSIDHTNGRAEKGQPVITEENKKSHTLPLNNGIVNGNQIIVEVETNMPVYKTNGMLQNSYTTKFLSKNEASIESPMPKVRGLSKADYAEESNVSADTGTKKKRPTDKAYFIAKELLVTERTYRKDLEVICFWLRDDFTKEDADIHILEAIDRLLSLMDPIYDAHCILLREVETRLSSWEPPYISDILNNFFENLNIYERYLEEHLSVLEEINSLFVSNPRFETLYREFESQKVCYLPVTTFILKPLQRLVHYSQILERLLKYYGKSHPHYEDCYQARTVLVNIAKFVPRILRQSENLVLLHELNRDVTGIENLVLPDREFIRQGCLSKFSQRKGYQQRMFFLFSDIMLYSNRLGHAFRIHGQLPLNNVMIEERPDTPQQHSFSIYGGNRVITVAANSEEEKDKWLEDLTAAIQKCKTNSKQRNGIDSNSLYYFSLKSCNSSDDIAEKYDDSHTRTLSVVNQRSNNTVYVCWHRNTSISIDDHLKAVENQLSGFLLRKFKNSNGWQKLWVVFTNFCLFFYKSFQEDCPLASLPLLGYSITTPSEKDAIQKEFVFKLQFKNHVYFFRAESEYTFNRWMEVIGNATQNYGRKNDAQSNTEIN